MESIYQTCLSVLLLLFMSCAQQSDTSGVTESKTDQIASDSANLTKSTTTYFNEILRQQKLVASNDIQMLSITDSLFSIDEINQGFYFLIFTKSMNGADGFYSEEVGRSAYEYLTTRTDQFIQNFRSIHELNDQDFENWAGYIYNEIQINNEGDELDGVLELENLLLEKARPINERGIKVIELLIKRMKSMSNNE